MSNLQNESQARRKNDPTEMLRSRAADFFRVLPSHVNHDVWLRMAESALVRDPKIYAAARNNPGAAMLALLECARLGHVPGTEHFYLTVRSNAIQGIESWKGMVQRILRSGQYVKVVAEVVYKGEVFKFNPNTDEFPTHEVDWMARSGADAPLMAYAYAVTHDGKASKVAIADPRYIAKVKAMSQGNVWAKWDEGMYLKTPVRMLVDFVDTSVEDLRIGDIHPQTPALTAADFDTDPTPQLEDGSVINLGPDQYTVEVPTTEDPATESDPEPKGDNT